MPLGTEVDLSSDDIVLDDDPNPPRKEAQHPPILAIHCGQTAPRIKTTLGMEVDLDPGQIV